MARTEDVLFRPHIDSIQREKIVKEKAKSSDIPEEIIDNKSKNILDSYKDRFKELEDLANNVLDRTNFLIDLQLEDIDGYLGDAPDVILQYTSELTGIEFKTEDNIILPKSDPVYTLDSDTIKCIFRIAEYPPYTNNPELSKAVATWDSAGFQQAVMNDLKKVGAFNAIDYGKKLIELTVKICYVVIVHYTVGYQCAQFRRLLGGFKIPYSVKFKKYKIKLKTFSLGNKIADVFKKIESALLKKVGFSCSSSDEIECNREKWDEVRFRRITCCTTSPFFFDGNNVGEPLLSTTKCFDQWVKAELEGENSVRNICDYNNKNKDDIIPTTQEILKAKAIKEYLMENGSKSGELSRTDLNPLYSAKHSANTALAMSKSIQSTLNSTSVYNRTEEKGGIFNCFGYSPNQGKIPTMKHNQSNSSPLFIELGAYFQEYLEAADKTILELLKYADKIVCGTANLARWGSSKQLCCYIYLLVIIASLFNSLITKGSICEDLDSENEDGFANKIRNELMWGETIQSNKEVEKFVALLRFIKQIIDIFIRKMERGLFLKGFILPFGQMFDEIKFQLLSSLSAFLDLLFGPLDSILVNIQAVPEIRHLINNECFGFDKFLSFLSCSLGSLKFGILDDVSNTLDKIRINDITLIDDIYLSRARFAFLRALSSLLKLMIDLIFSIKDCYDPNTITNMIIEKQQDSMMETVANLGLMLKTKENAKKLDECSESLFGQNFIPEQDVIRSLDNDISTLSHTFGELGPIGDIIVETDLFCSNCESPFKIAEFFTEDGNIIPPAEFIEKAEKFSDVKLSDLKVSMNNIFEILRG